MPLSYKGVEYSIKLQGPGVWQWHFQIGDKEFAGKTETRLELLAERRAQLRINTALKRVARGVQGKVAIRFR